MNAAIIDRYIIHLEVRLFALLLSRKFDKGITKRVTRAFIANDFAGLDFSETRKDEFQILISGHRI
jgi:hypothetical protein